MYLKEKQLDEQYTYLKFFLIVFNSFKAAFNKSAPFLI